MHRQSLQQKIKDLNMKQS